jgi:hypothetical protein
LNTNSDCRNCLLLSSSFLNSFSPFSY